MDWGELRKHKHFVTVFSNLLNLGEVFEKTAKFQQKRFSLLESWIVTVCRVLQGMSPVFLNLLQNKLDFVIRNAKTRNAKTSNIFVYFLSRYILGNCSLIINAIKFLITFLHAPTSPLHSDIFFTMQNFFISSNTSHRLERLAKKYDFKKLQFPHFYLTSRKGKNGK